MIVQSHLKWQSVLPFSNYSSSNKHTLDSSIYTFFWIISKSALCWCSSTLYWASGLWRSAMQIHFIPIEIDHSITVKWCFIGILDDNTRLKWPFSACLLSLRLLFTSIEVLMDRRFDLLFHAFFQIFRIFFFHSDFVIRIVFNGISHCIEMYRIEFLVEFSTIVTHISMTFFIIFFFSKFLRILMSKWEEMLCGILDLRAKNEFPRIPVWEFSDFWF